MKDNNCNFTFTQTTQGNKSYLKCKMRFSLLKIALHILILVFPLGVRNFGHIVIQLKWKLSALSFRRGQLPAIKFYKVFNLVHKYLTRIGWYTSWSKVRNQRETLENNLCVMWKLYKTKAQWPMSFSVVKRTTKTFLSILITPLAHFPSQMHRLQRDEMWVSMPFSQGSCHLFLKENRKFPWKPTMRISKHSGSIWKYRLLIFILIHTHTHPYRPTHTHHILTPKHRPPPPPQSYASITTSQTG